MKDAAGSIMDVVRRRDLLNDQTLSETQTVCLKAIYGEPLNDHEREIYFRGTGRATYEETEQREVTIIAGRRSGKTGKIAAPVACFEAFRKHGLPRGEYGYVMLLAPTIAQAQIAFRYVRSYLRNSKILSQRILHATRNEIALDNNVVIGCYACTYGGVRGRTIIAAIADEIAFWSDADGSANPAEEVLAALRPGMANIRNAKLIKLSTPFAKCGLLWDEFDQRSELTFAVWQVTTFAMNPTIKPEMVESERLLSEEKFQREYNAQFTDSINGWIVPEILNPCIVRNRRELPRQVGVTYFAAIDPASRGNDFALVILHQTRDGRLVMDRIACWTGTKTAPLPFEPVLAEVKQILESYGLNSVTGDQYYSDAISQHFLKIGIYYNLLVFSAQTRAKHFSGLKHLMVQGKIELLDNVDLLRQLRNLREEKSSRGNIDVRPSSGNDDIAVALALAASQALTQESSFELINVDCGPSPESLGLIPGDCRVEADCRNFPACVDEGYCKGWERESRGVALIQLG